MHTRDRHFIASRELALEDIKKRIEEEHRANSKPVPPPEELQRLAQEYLDRHTRQSPNNE